MLKKYEVETMINDALLEMDGVLSDKPNEDGTYNLYFADVSTDDEHNIVLTFDTYIGNEKIDTDRYKIKVEYITEMIHNNKPKCKHDWVYIGCDEYRCHKCGARSYI